MTSPSTAPLPTTPLHTAVFGSGSRAKRILGLLKTLPTDFEIAGFFTSDKARRKELEASGLSRGWEAASELCRSAQLAIITGLPDTHLTQGLIALEAGCHLIVEKPVALKSTDAETLTATVTRLNRQAFVFHPHRFQDGLDELAVFARASRVLLVRLTSQRFRPASRYTHPARRDPKRVGPGPLWDMGVHLMDLLDFVMPCHVVSAEGSHKSIGLDFPLHNVSRVKAMAICDKGALPCAPTGITDNRANSSLISVGAHGNAPSTFELHIEINDAAPGRPRLEIEITTQQGSLLWANGRLVSGPIPKFLHALRPRTWKVRDEEFLRAVAAALRGIPNPRLATLESAVRVTGNLERLHPSG